MKKFHYKKSLMQENSTWTEYTWSESTAFLIFILKCTSQNFHCPLFCPCNLLNFLKEAVVIVSYYFFLITLTCPLMLTQLLFRLLMYILPFQRLKTVRMGNFSSQIANTVVYKITTCKLLTPTIRCVRLNTCFSESKSYLNCIRNTDKYSTHSNYNFYKLLPSLKVTLPRYLSVLVSSVRTSELINHAASLPFWDK